MADDRGSLEKRVFGMASDSARRSRAHLESAFFSRLVQFANCSDTRGRINEKSFIRVRTAVLQDPFTTVEGSFQFMLFSVVSRSVSLRDISSMHVLVLPREMSLFCSGCSNVSLFFAGPKQTLSDLV